MDDLMNQSGNWVGLIKSRPLSDYGYLALILAVTVVPCYLAKLVYNVLFHPLRSYPGPILFRATSLMKVFYNLRGEMAFKVEELHDRYGPVVRIAPNELAFMEAAAWKDIYGHRPGGELEKWEGLYRLQGRSAPTHIINAGREEHSMLRRAVAHGFSEQSMRGQEPIIGSYVDLLIRRLHEYAEGESKALDLKEWINWTTFDIIGNLAFGSDFGSLQKAQYDPWVKMVATNVRVSFMIQSMTYLNLNWLVDFAMRNDLIPSQREHMKNMKAKMERRMQHVVERPDLIEGLIRKQDQLPMEKLLANASVLVIAGSETTASLLTGAIFALLTNPDQLSKLTDEIRSTFNSEHEITLTSVQSLSYMLACLNEALRIYPPVVTGMPRVTPKGGAVICGRHIPENTVVAVWQWAINHSPDLWVDPYEFHPERFTGDARYANDKLEAMQPFSAGSRNCVGRNLAYAEMRLILARIIYNFDMKLSETSKGWLKDQKAYFVWDKPSLYVYMTPVKR